MAKILIVEDDKNICELLKLYLAAEGYSLGFAYDGSRALDVFREFAPDLVLLDLMLPIISGEQVCQLLRKDSPVPIIMITAKDRLDDKINGLELGADDYISKPFDPKEVVARIKAQLRGRNLGAQGAQEEVKRPEALDGLLIDLEQFQVWLDDKPVDLKPKEIQLLQFFVEHPNKVFTRDQLIEYVWGYDFLGDSRTVDVHVKCLRQKLKNERKTWFIKTVWGIGYKFEVKE